MKARNEIQILTESRLTRLETTQESINDTLKRLDKKIEKLDVDMKDGFKNVLNKLDSMDSRLWQVLLLGIGGFLGTLSLIAKLHHWI